TSPPEICSPNSSRAWHMNTSTDRHSFVAHLERQWAYDARWRGVTRPYTPEDVWRLRGSLAIAHTLASYGARRLWNALTGEGYLAALSAVTGNQAVQAVRAGLQAIYVSGWQVAADANEAGGRSCSGKTWGRGGGVVLAPTGESGAKPTGARRAAEVSGVDRLRIAGTGATGATLLTGDCVGYDRRSVTGGRTTEGFSRFGA